MKAVRTVLLYGFLTTYLVVGSLLVVPVARLLRRPHLVYAAARFGIAVALRLGGLRLTVEGRQKMGGGRNMVVVTNHQSHLDAPVLIMALGDLRTVAKKEIFRIPFLSQVIRTAGFVELDRSDPRRAKASLEAAVDLLRGGGALLVFPEGTRAFEKELGTFKKGAFVTAIQAQSRVLPVVLDGFLEAMPRGSVLIHPGRLRMRVLDPVDAGSYSYDDRGALAAEVRSRIAAAMAEGGA